MKASDGDKYLGSKYNVKIQWETGEISWLPLSATDPKSKKKWGAWHDDRVTVAIYARENNLLDTPGWI